MMIHIVAIKKYEKTSVHLNLNLSNFKRIQIIPSLMKNVLHNF